MGGDAGSMLGNVAGRCLGVLSALPSRGGGFSNLANYMAARQRAMSDPNARAALTPFGAGFYQIGGGMEPGPPGPATSRAVAAPSRVGAGASRAVCWGRRIPTPAGPAQSLFVQPGQPGPAVWKPHLPALAPEAAVEQAAQERIRLDLPNPATHTRAPGNAPRGRGGASGAGADPARSPEPRHRHARAGQAARQDSVDARGNERAGHERPAPPKRRGPL